MAGAGAGNGTQLSMGIRNLEGVIERNVVKLEGGDGCTT